MQREDAATPMDSSAAAAAPMAYSPPPPASTAAEQEPAVRPNTRDRSGSPGSAGESGGGGVAHGGASYPMCQVEHCLADLTTARAYNRRHKVCVKCSLTAETFVAGRMQRFCQQCSSLMGIGSPADVGSPYSSSEEEEFGQQKHCYL